MNCPVCGKPRGKGPYEFVHGPCMEAQARDESRVLKQPAFPDASPEPLRSLTKAHVRTGKDKERRNNYLKGRLPKWMMS